MIVEYNCLIEFFLQCDENKPECYNCQNYGTSCQYYSQPQWSHERSTSLFAIDKPDMLINSLSASIIAADIDKVIQDHPTISSRSLREGGSTIPVYVVALHHFVNFATETIVSRAARDVMKTEMIRIAFNVHGRSDRDFIFLLKCIRHSMHISCIQFWVLVSFISIVPSLTTNRIGWRRLITGNEESSCLERLYSPNLAYTIWMPFSRRAC